MAQARAASLCVLGVLSHCPAQGKALLLGRHDVCVLAMHVPWAHKGLFLVALNAFVCFPTDAFMSVLARDTEFTLRFTVLTTT